MTTKEHTASALIGLITVLVLLFNALIPTSSVVHALSENVPFSNGGNDLVAEPTAKASTSYIQPKFIRPEPRKGTTTGRTAQISEGFEALECDYLLNQEGDECEVVEAGKHLRWTYSGSGAPILRARVEPSNVDMPVSWRAVVSHTEIYNYGSQYPYNSIEDYLKFYAKTGSTYFDELIAETPPGYVAGYSGLVIEWKGMAQVKASNQALNSKSRQTRSIWN